MGEVKQVVDAAMLEKFQQLPGDPVAKREQKISTLFILKIIITFIYSHKMSQDGDDDAYGGYG